VILPDANVLLYAIDETSPRHAVAKRWLEAALTGPETVGLAWSVLMAVVRLTTRPAIFERPLSVQEAFELVDGWLRQPPVVTVEPTQRHLAILRGLLEPLGTAGNLVPDAHLAALAIEHGGRVVSADHDFGRFPGLRWLDPFSPVGPR
jgi:toxin-antitoxin system PIN domain toxin